MSDLINKYNEQREIFLEALFLFHKANIDFLNRQSPKKTSTLRKSLKKMRIAAKNMENLAQARMKERSKEWLEARPKVQERVERRRKRNE